MSAIPTFIRKDGRQTSELRGKELRLSELNQFDGSSWYAQGLTSVAVTVHGPTLAKQENYRECDVAVRVLNGFESNPAAGGADRLSQKERRRIQTNERDAYQIEMLVENCVRAIFLRERFPRCVLAIDVILYHDGGSLASVVVNAVMAALLDAGVPCRSTMAAVSIALIDSALVASDVASPTPAATEAKTSSSSSSSAAAAAVSSSSHTQRDFVLDPTDAEETLCVVEPPVQLTQESRVGAKRDRNDSNSDDATGTASTTRSATLGGASLSAQKVSVRRETVACGTFVVLNPNSGGGLLASHVRRTAARTAVHVKTGVKASTSSYVAPNTTMEEVEEMAKLAERAAPFVFDLFRQCNVPL